MGAEVVEQVDLGAVKARQQVAWSSGDYAVVGTTLQIVGETLCEAADLAAGWRVLDVAAGNGNASLAAARRNCEVVASDYVPSLLERLAARAAADGLPIETREADAEALPFDDDSFDGALSTFGVMFAPDHVACASELARVVRPGGRIGLANWTPGGFVGQMFKVIGGYVPPPAGVASPLLWGTEEHLRELFATAKELRIEQRQFVFRYRNATHWVDVFRNYYGPFVKAFAALDADGQNALASDLEALATQNGEVRDGGLAIPSDYLEVVITV